MLRAGGIVPGVNEGLVLKKWIIGLMGVIILQNFVLSPRDKDTIGGNHV